MTNALARPRVLLEIAPNLQAEASVYQKDDVVFLEIDAITPLGPIRATLQTDFESYLKMAEYARDKKVAHRLADFLAGKFGRRPVLSRVGGSNAPFELPAYEDTRLNRDGR